MRARFNVMMESLEIQVMRELLASIASRCPGGKLPDTYLVFDTETSGVDLRSVAILQYGMTFVENRQRLNNFTAYVKRSRDVYIHPKAQEVHGITHDFLDEHGEDPAVVVPAVVGCLNSWKAKGMLVGHNVMTYDLPILQKDATQHGLTIEYGENEVIDTGMMVKATQLGLTLDTADTLASFYRRVSSIFAKGVFWSLDRHCVPTYGLEKRAESVNMDVKRKHDAGVDCDLSHLLLEALRELHEEQNAH
jgi:DNA polymerase III epsilon subunit-like protein